MKRFIPFILLLVIVSSCKYEKLLKSRDYKLKYQKALEYYADEDYMRAEGLFEQLKPLLKGTKQSDTVFFYAAYCSYNQNDFLLGSHYFEEFYKTFGNSHFAEEAEYMAAYCKYNLSPRPSLDQTYTYGAISDFSLFVTRHPNSSKVDECVTLIEEMRDKLVEKSYESAKLYYKLEDYKAAIIALNNSLEDFPQTKYREEIMYLILKSKFLYAEKSVIVKQKERYQAYVDEYYSFIDEFSKSDYLKDVERMYNDSSKKLGI